ncbi:MULTISPECIES: GntR family transcriptional regulator [Rhodococcus]|uniref:GntR family transcriptional regulator n=1 Tax=Rhodococcus zopfii TaxID=43772 RepID=A0ABU3WXJ2_9NOCA|nr:GntR family transcriptional regulator [Rhodococcus zopfii]MDV2478477.1 GntR family transcriptional regulator [Rhodococcus zopfii]
MIIQESLVSMAADGIRKMVIGGELRQGDKLNEPPLAERLGISRPPLREALRTLEAEGILEQTPRRGYRVVVLTDTDIEEIYSLRRSLEDFALTLIERHRTPEMFDELDAVMRRMRSAASAGDRPAVVQANVDFHVGVVAASGHRRLVHVYRTLMVQMQLSMATNVLTEERSSGDLLKGCERHERLLSSLRYDDPNAVRKAFDEHGELDYVGTAAAIDTKGERA